MRDIAPVHPGRILADQYLIDLGLSQRKLAGLIDVARETGDVKHALQR